MCNTVDGHVAYHIQTLSATATILLIEEKVENKKKENVLCQ